MLDLLKEESFTVSYENDGLSSYLILSLGLEKKVFEYQIEMIKNNPVNSILQVDLRHKNNELKLYYNVTSKVSLSHFLKRKRLEKNEFIDILKNITKTLLIARNYFLYDKNFLLKEEHIYINPATLETSLVYVPIEVETNLIENFKDFVVGLIVGSAQIDETSSGNFIHRILNFLKTETFNIADFSKFLGELRGEAFRDMSNIGPHQKEPREVNQKLADLNILKIMPTSIKRMILPEIPFRPNIILIAFLMQVLIVIGLIITYQIVLLKYKPDAYTMAGLIIVGAGIDFLILRNLFVNKTEEKPSNILIKEMNESVYKENNYHLDENINSTCEADTGWQLNEGLTGGGVETILLEDFALQQNYAYLETKEDGIVKKVYVKNKSFIIGRLKGQVDYVSKSNAVSKIHAEIVCRDGRYYINDLNSKNGTFVNGNRINSNVEYEIQDNDILKLANSEFIFHICREITSY